MKQLATTDVTSPAIHAAPLYSQLSNVFRDLIRQGKWSVGSTLPSEAELARKFGVSVGTARKALESLEESGWIIRRQGRGTFVADPAVQQFDRFCRIFLSNGGANLFGLCTAKILKQVRTPVTADEAVLLCVPRTTQVVRLERLFERQGVPVLLESQVLLADVFEGLESREDLPVNLFGVFLRDYGVSIHRCTERIAAEPAPESVSDALDIDTGKALLHTRHKLEDVEGRNMGLVERWLETGNVEYMVALT